MSVSVDVVVCFVYAIVFVWDRFMHSLVIQDVYNIVREMICIYVRPHVHILWTAGLASGRH